MVIFVMIVRKNISSYLLVIDLDICVKTLCLTASTISYADEHVFKNKKQRKYLNPPFLCVCQSILHDPM